MTLEARLNLAQEMTDYDAVNRCNDESFDTIIIDGKFPEEEEKNDLQKTQ